MLNMRRSLTGLLASTVIIGGFTALWAGSAAPPPPGVAPSAAPAPPPGQAPLADPGDATPPRVSYLNGEVSFLRQGAQDWAPATVNMPLAPGDIIYTGPAGNAEIQIGPRAFVRAAYGAQLGLDNQEPDFTQIRVTAGYAAVDLRELQPGHSVELDTPGGAFTMERPGYYHAEVGQDSTTFRTHRGGTATMTPSGGQATPVATNQQIVITGAEAPHVETTAAAQLSAWDHWNYQRSDYLVQPASAKYVGSAMYGAEALDQSGSWRTVETYGSVWVPTGVQSGWVPYSTGRWIWDPRFGWTWLDEAPWGWAPYHYGRWVYAGGFWAWAPGPVLVRPAYSPALVVFLGGPVVVGRPFYWAPLGWGEPVVRWWGGPRFVGVAWWGGWGGPHVVNNVVVARGAVVNVTNITVYHNVAVNNAVVGVPADRFGQGSVRPARLTDVNEVRRLAPVRGAPDVRPVAASLAPGTGPAAVRPSDAVRTRAVVATRAPQDFSPALRAQGLAASPVAGAQPQQRIVPAPTRTVTPQAAPAAQNAGPGRGPGGAARTPAEDGTPRARGERGARQGGAPDAARQTPAARQAGAPAPQVPGAPPAPNVQGAPGAQAAPHGEGKGGRAPGERAAREPGKGAPKAERGEKSER
jgi:hypothetical protein